MQRRRELKVGPGVVAFRAEKGEGERLPMARYAARIGLRPASKGAAAGDPAQVYPRSVQRHLAVSSSSLDARIARPMRPRRMRASPCPDGRDSGAIAAIAAILQPLGVTHEREWRLLETVFGHGVAPLRGPLAQSALTSGTASDGTQSTGMERCAEQPHLY